jgi:hypothetical protein
MNFVGLYILSVKLSNGRPVKVTNFQNSCTKPCQVKR